MTDLDQVKAQIRFGLEQLSVKNAHHEFEHLCRHLTRARICSNIIPSTGPVSGGGDLGRDFETFRTYLSSSPISSSTFVGLVSNQMIAFACSLEKDIRPKIKSDVRTIMESEAKVGAVQYFCSADIQVSRRHELKNWAREEYSIDLEIYDGQAISELLAGRDVFWIAERYLSIPAEIYPVSPAKELGDWYQQLLEEWKEKTDYQAFNYADFVEIKSALRHATFNEDVKQDLAFWLGLMENLSAKAYSETLKRKAAYEIAVASLRGLGTLEGQEERLREYFSKIPDLTDATDIEDASILLTYCMGAIFQNRVNLLMNEVLKLRDELIGRTEDLLAGAEDKPNLKCMLLETRGFQCMTIDPVKRDCLDIDDAFKRWMEMTELVNEAPLFPLERFADHLTEYMRITHEVESIQHLGDHPLYEELSKRVDKLLAERYGAFKAAEKCRDRALAFYDSRKIVKAINQLHHAKIKWFAEETLQASLTSMLFIAKCYSELGLSFAAKYYALAAAFVAFNSKDEEIKNQVSHGLIGAAEYDYVKGNWCGFLELAHTGIQAHMLYSKEEASDPHDRVNRTVFHLVTILVIVERLAPELTKYVENIAKRLSVDDVVKELIPTARNVWKEKEISEIWTSLEEQLDGRPFNDLGKIREGTWFELGVTWTVKWPNDYQTTDKAEQFIAFLQIFLADLVGVDLCLLKTDVTINLSVANIAKPKVKADPSNVGRIWNVTLPSHISKEEGAVDKPQPDTFATASTILMEISLLPRDEFLKVLENCFKEGLSMKAYVVAPYELLYREFVTEEIFELSEKSSQAIPEPQRKYPIKKHKELQWYSGPGPGYSKESAKEYLKNRYSRLPIPIKYTLKRLSKNPEFIKTVEKLRAEGWLDWHIMAAVASATINYRVNQIPEARGRPEEQKKIFMKIMDEPEKKDASEVPLHIFSEEKLRNFLIPNMLSTLKGLGLECRQCTPDLKAIDHFLRHRYSYWTDDIEHEDPFKAE